MRHVLGAFLFIAVCVAPAAAQHPSSRWYVGMAAGGTNVITDAVNGGGVQSVGVLAGVNLTPSLAIEGELGRGFGDLSRELVGWRISYAGPGATREEIERMAVDERIRSRSRQTLNRAIMIVWTDRSPRRVTGAVFAGLTWNTYDHRTTSEILRLPAGITPEQVARNISRDERYSRTLGGITGGFSVPIAVTRQLRVAPEVSYTHGDIGDRHYHLLSARARLLWRF